MASGAYIPYTYEDLMKDIARVKLQLEAMDDDEAALRRSLTAKFRDKSPKEIDEKCDAALAEYRVLTDDVAAGTTSKPPPPLPPQPAMQRQLLLPIIAADPLTREHIALLREGLPDRASTKGLSWSNEEESLFLLGMKYCGRGDWKNISRYFVLSRTPTQIASHAQKFFSLRARRKREAAAARPMIPRRVNDVVLADAINGRFSSARMSSKFLMSAGQQRTALLVASRMIPPSASDRGLPAPPPNHPAPVCPRDDGDHPQVGAMAAELMGDYGMTQ